MTASADSFSLDKVYLFLYKPTTLDNRVVTGTIRAFKNQHQEKITMTFVLDGKEKFEVIKAYEILAVEDNDGEASIKGCAGKFKILNHHRFNKLALDGIIEFESSPLETAH